MNHVTGPCFLCFYTEVALLLACFVMIGAIIGRFIGLL